MKDNDMWLPRNMLTVRTGHNWAPQLSQLMVIKTSTWTLITRLLLIRRHVTTALSTAPNISNLNCFRFVPYNQPEGATSPWRKYVSLEVVTPTLGPPRVQLRGGRRRRGTEATWPWGATRATALSSWVPGNASHAWTLYRHAWCLRLERRIGHVGSCMHRGMFLPIKISLLLLNTISWTLCTNSVVPFTRSKRVMLQNFMIFILYRLSF